MDEKEFKIDIISVLTKMNAFFQLIGLELKSEELLKQSIEVNDFLEELWSGAIIPTP